MPCTSPPTSQPVVLIKTPEVLRLLRIGRKRLAEAIEAGLLPRPVTLGPRCRMWDLDAIKHHLAQRASDPSPASTEDATP